MPSAVPTGLKILAYSPTDKSVGYFHLSLWDKTKIWSRRIMETFSRFAIATPFFTRWQYTKNLGMIPSYRGYVVVLFAATLLLRRLPTALDEILQGILRATGINRLGGDFQPFRKIFSHASGNNCSGGVQ